MLMIVFYKLVTAALLIFFFFSLRTTFQQVPCYLFTHIAPYISNYLPSVHTIAYEIGIEHVSWLVTTSDLESCWNIYYG